MVSFSSLFLTLSACVGAFAQPQPLEGRSVPQGTGTNHGYFYSFYNEGGDGSGPVTYKNGAAGQYSITWNNDTDFTAGKGWAIGANRSIEYTAKFNPIGNAYLSVYGWTTSPLVEYYILENYGDYNPASSLVYRGTVTSDGSLYDIYENLRVNQPSIEGTATFEQFWSIRNNTRSKGVVTTANHFNAWNSLGMTLGTFNYQILATEGYESSGSSIVKLLTKPA